MLNNLTKTQQRNLLIGGIVLLVLFIEFGVKPWVDYRDARKTVTSVLENWSQGGDVLKSMEYWDVQDDYKPVFGVTTYKILKAKRYKGKRLNRADFTVQIYFNSDQDVFPNGKNWLFKTIETEFGWKVEDFYLLSESDEGDL